ncbi:MAG: ATP-dependent RecD-like DNA helicase [Candidatus Aminicenantes bacterium]|nr:ATP-dependent RecD-like DNA helicase [Candidatus Aminicenantes bacterium]
MDTATGTIDQIVFYSPDTGYTVCRFTLEGGERVTIVGSFPPLNVGEVLKVSGKWEMNPRFGKQFRVDAYTPVLPSSVTGVEKFLASGLIRGIGPALAGRIVKKFGDETLDVLEKSPKKLGQVEGIGPVKLREIQKSWKEHRRISDLIIYLQGHNVSTNLATKIYQEYGEKSFQVLKTNPYQACHDIWGIGFKTADQMALKLGIEPDSPERVKAYIRYLMEKDNEQGHVFSLQSALEEGCCRELGVPAERFTSGLRRLEEDRRIVTEKLGDDRAVYLPFFHAAQDEVVRGIHRLAIVRPKIAAVSALAAVDTAKAVTRAEMDMGIKFAGAQKTAVEESLRRKILVITGGPGTGKTTIVRAVVDIAQREGKGIQLAAPTGRAAKRLAEATGIEARTIHRMLEYNPKKGEFRRNAANPLPGDLLIVDEFSMVDLPLMFHLLKALPDGMRLILVGDKDQLPSVGPGNLLRDIIASERVEVVRLDEIFRQEKDSLIVTNAHRVNSGGKLVFPEKGDKDSDCYFMNQDDEEKAFETVLNLCAVHMPQKLGLPARSAQIQVISPMYRGLVGVDNLNVELQKRLNPENEGLKLGTREIRLNDKVMQIRNNYDKEVYNGDIGLVCGIDGRNYGVEVDFEGRGVYYTRDELNELVLAYAISVHKSQGSEYAGVVLPLMTQHFIMLQRNLFYTALTRAKRLSVIVGSWKALYIAVKNDKPVQRNSLLKEKLLAAAGARPPFV